MANEDKVKLDDSRIFGVTSPRDRLGGPYEVVYKDENDLWAIVALDWDGKPRLGMRWFWTEIGNPSSTGYPTWMIIPSALSKSILNGLPLTYEHLTKIEMFLRGDMEGEELLSLRSEEKAA